MAVGIESTAPADVAAQSRATDARGNSHTAAQTPQTGLAVRGVTDGDTFTLDDGRRVRLAQVDAPETNECFGPQSTGSLRALVDGETVTLRRPSTGPEHDRYGRTLAEVFVGGRSVNEMLVHDGAAEWYEEFAGEDANSQGGFDRRRAGPRSRGRACGPPVRAPLLLRQLRRLPSQLLLRPAGTAIPPMSTTAFPRPRRISTAPTSTGRSASTTTTEILIGSTPTRTGGVARAIDESARLRHRCGAR
jgi:endonuclease YncB( thermonuclease family)